MTKSSFQLNKLLATPVESFSNAPLPLFLSFLTLVLSNCLLSYGTLSPSAKAWTALFGLALPLFLILLPGGNNRVSFKNEVLSAPPAGVWILLGICAIALRFFRLASLSSWPLVDEGFFNYFPIHLGENWNWNLQEGPAQEPMLYTWLLAPFFKIFKPSLAALWFFPALCSTACVAVAWRGTQKKFPGSLSFFSTAYMAFGFWPLYVGRIGGPYILMVLWECLALSLLGRLWATPEKPDDKTLYGLAILTGAGFYTYLAWPLAACVIFLGIFFRPYAGQKKRLETALKFLGITLLFLLPLAFSYARENRGYFHDLFAFGGNHDWNGRLHLGAAYFTDLFWGDRGGSFRYGPLWGGLLNPITISLVFLGIASLLKSRQKRTIGLVFSALVIFFLPALLSRSLEIMRLIGLLPLLAMLVALGAQYLLSALPHRGRGLLAAALFLTSFSVDAFHLFGIYPKHWLENPTYYGNHKSPEFYRAYSLLKPIAQEKGPGMIFLNFNPDPYDQTLFVATYSFNSAENPALDSSKAPWAAILANIHEQPYLKKIFPAGNFAWLSKDQNRADGGILLEMIPVNPETQEILIRWAKADRALKELTYLDMELGVDPDQTLFMEVLQKAYPLFEGDPLLESRYWRIMALHHRAEGEMMEAVGDYQKAIGRGYPQAQLDNELGCLWYQLKDRNQARKAFEQALKLKPNFTGAEENLKNLALSDPMAP